MFSITSLTKQERSRSNTSKTVQYNLEDVAVVDAIDRDMDVVEVGFLTPAGIRNVALEGSPSFPNTIGVEQEIGHAISEDEYQHYDRQPLPTELLSSSSSKFKKSTTGIISKLFSKTWMKGERLTRTNKVILNLEEIDIIDDSERKESVIEVEFPEEIPYDEDEAYKAGPLSGGSVEIQTGSLPIVEVEMEPGSLSIVEVEIETGSLPMIEAEDHHHHNQQQDVASTYDEMNHAMDRPIEVELPISTSSLSSKSMPTNKTARIVPRKLNDLVGGGRSYQGEYNKNRRMMYTFLILAGLCSITIIGLAIAQSLNNKDTSQQQEGQHNTTSSSSSSSGGTSSTTTTAGNVFDIDTNNPSNGSSNNSSTTTTSSMFTSSSNGVIVVEGNNDEQVGMGT